MKKAVIILSAIALLSCNQATKKQAETRIYINTSEFINFEKTAKIKYDEAVEIHNKYCNEKDISFPYCFPQLLYCEGENYIFGYQTTPINDKMKRVMILYTLRINSQTGNITEILGVYKTQK